MNTAFVLLQAQAGGDYSFLIMMVAIFAIMYFFMIRPQNKKQKEIQNFRKNLEVGQEVYIEGGNLTEKFSVSLHRVLQEAHIQWH